MTCIPRRVDRDRSFVGLTWGNPASLRSWAVTIVGGGEVLGGERDHCFRREVFVGGRIYGPFQVPSPAKPVHLKSKNGLKRIFGKGGPYINDHGL